MKEGCPLCPYLWGVILAIQCLFQCSVHCVVFSANSLLIIFHYLRCCIPFSPSSLHPEYVAPEFCFYLTPRFCLLGLVAPRKAPISHLLCVCRVAMAALAMRLRSALLGMPCESLHWRLHDLLTAGAWVHVCEHGCFICSAPVGIHRSHNPKLACD